MNIWHWTFAGKEGSEGRSEGWLTNILMYVCRNMIAAKQINQR